MADNFSCRQGDSAALPQGEDSMRVIKQSEQRKIAGREDLLKGESGVALLEGAIVLPFLLTMLFATFDLGAALNQYLLLNRLVYEGTRYAATLPGLETGRFGVSSDTSVSGYSPYVVGSGQDKVKSRLITLIGRSGFDMSSFTLMSTENSGNNAVTVTLQKTYTPMFGFFGSIPLKVTATGPYLSRPVS